MNDRYFFLIDGKIEEREYPRIAIPKLKVGGGWTKDEISHFAVLAHDPKSELYVLSVYGIVKGRNYGVRISVGDNLVGRGNWIREIILSQMENIKSMDGFERFGIKT